MTKTSKTIAIGGRQFELRPLTVGQLAAVETAISNNAGALPLALAISVLKIGLARTYPNDPVEELEATATEIAAGMAAVLEQGGFLDGNPPPDVPAEAA